MFFNSSKEKKSKYLKLFGTVFSGALFTAGLWLFIDGAYAKIGHKMQAPGYVAFIFTALAGILLNFLNWSTVAGTNDDSPLQKGIARILFFTTIVVMIGGFAGSFCVMYYEYIVPSYENRPGVEIFLSTIITIISFAIFRFVRTDTE